MTDKPDLDAIEARCNAATEGPWEIYSTGEDGFEEWFLDMPGRPATVFADGGSITSNRLSPDDQDEANLAFCAHARQDIPALTAALRAAWEDNETLLREHNHALAVIREAS